MKTTLITLATTLVLAACGGGGDDGSCNVTYEVIGNNTQQRVLITMAPPAGPALQGTFSVWPTAHREEYEFKNGDFLYVSGQNANTAFTAGFTVRILVDGVVKASTEGFGYSVATAEFVCK